MPASRGLLAVVLTLALGGCVATPIPLPDPTGMPDGGWTGDLAATQDAGRPDIKSSWPPDGGSVGADQGPGGDSALPDGGPGDGPDSDGWSGEGGIGDGGPLEGGGGDAGRGQDLTAAD